MTVRNVFPLVDLTDICGTITCRLKGLSSLLFSSQKATECCGAALLKNAALPRIRCSLLCSVVPMDCDAVSLLCPPFAHTLVMNLNMSTFGNLNEAIDK